MKYKCDRCDREHLLIEENVKNKQHYITPHGCYGGDYYVHEYYWFECNCGRAINVNIKDLLHPLDVVKDYTEHRGVSV
jgi:hypothetical protein